MWRDVGRGMTGRGGGCDVCEWECRGETVKLPESDNFSQGERIIGPSLESSW